MSLTATTVLAIYGAGLSTAAFAWNVLREVRDRGRLKVHCFVGKLVESGKPLDDTSYLIWNVTNVGRRPIMVTHVGGLEKTKDGVGHFWIKNTTLPKMLQPGEYTIIYSPKLDQISSLSRLSATDSTGGTHYATRSTLKYVRKQLADKGIAG
jgi:hypothetical protein